MPDLQDDSSSSATGFLDQLPPRPISSDDMDDRAEIAYYREAIAAGKPGWKPLLQALELFQSIVAPEFNEEDQLALKFQASYQRYSQWAVGMGAFTVCLAILQLAAHLHVEQDDKTHRFIPYARIFEATEVFAAVTTFLIIVVAIAVRPKEKWLTARFKAEALRVFKFNKLCDSRLWSGHSGDRALLGNELRAEVAEMRRKTFRDADDWATQGTVPAITAVTTSAKCADAQDEFIRYYRAKRVEAQMSYLERKARQREEEGTKWSVVLQVLFWGSLAFVLGHVALSLGAAGEREVVSNTLIALAAWLPAIAGGIRTYKSSREFERNAARHEATLFILERLATRLDASRSCEESYATIGFCEQVLEADSREWMRLMVSAEWYG